MSLEGIAPDEDQDRIDLRWCVDQVVQLRALLISAADTDMPRFAGKEVHQPATFLDLLAPEVEEPLRRFLNEGEL